MIDREHIPAITQSARAALQSLNEFIRVQQVGRTPLISDERMYEFLVCRHALRRLLISAGCFDQHRVTVYPLEGPAHAAMLILAAEVGPDGDSLPPQIEAFAVRLTEVVRVLEGLQPAPTSESPATVALPQVAISADLAYRALRDYAAEELKGAERRAVEVLCDNNGSLTLADFALSMKWDCFDNGKFSSLQSRLNKKTKLGGRGWRLVRRDNHAQLQPCESATKK